MMAQSTNKSSTGSDVSIFHTSAKAAGKPEAGFLDIVWMGLEHISKHVMEIEHERIAAMPVSPERAKEMYYCSFGSEPGDSLVCNYFLWYASACYNFIQLFTKAFKTGKVLKRQFSSIHVWRHKVSAHTAWSVRPRKNKPDDSIATKRMSISLFPEFCGGHFEVGGFVVASPGEGRSNSEWRWCLVTEHERLRALVLKYL